jgi:hypothetical protein
MPESTIKIVIENGGLLTPDRTGSLSLQKVATVFIPGHEQYRVYAPAEAQGEAMEWKRFFIVYQPSRMFADSEEEVEAPQRVYVAKLVEEELQRLKRDRNRPVGMNPDGIYYDAYICLHCHVISSGRIAVNPSEHCSRCGSAIIEACQDCGTPIRGIHTHAAIHTYQRPDFCHKRGSPYPWMRETMDTARELLYHDEKLSIDDKNKLWDQLKYVISDPKSTLVPAKKKLIEFDLAKAASVTREFVLDAIARIAVEAAKG